MRKIISGSLLLGLLVASPAVLAGCGQQTSSQTQSSAVKVHVIASNYKWTLDKTSFKVNVPIDFVVSSTQGTHGFSITGTKISQQVSQGNKPVDVVWKPTKPGTYVIRCNIYCGSGHADMWTKIHVHS